MTVVCTKAGEERETLEVLVADDEPLIRDSVAEILRTRGHRVETVGSAEEALSSARVRMPDVVIVDWRMPGGGGRVVEGLLADGAFQGRIFLLTGSITGDEEAVLRDGVERIGKPFSYLGLVARVEGREEG